jgi:hypothetical protein
MDDCVAISLCVRGVSVCPANETGTQILAIVVVNYISGSIMWKRDS